MKLVLASQGIALGLAAMSVTAANQASEVVQIPNAVFEYAESMETSEDLVELPEEESELVPGEIYYDENGEVLFDLRHLVEESSEDNEYTADMIGNPGVTTTMMNLVKKYTTLNSAIAQCEGAMCIGYNRGIQQGKGRGITDAEAELLLNGDIDRFEKSLTKSLPWYPSMPEPQRGALLSMAFQNGYPGVLSRFKTVLNNMKNKQWDEASRNMLATTWAKQTKGRAQRHAQQVRTGTWVSKPGFPKIRAVGTFKQKMKDLFVPEEGLRLFAYMCSAKVWTIGVGRMIDRRKGGKIQDFEADKLLSNDLAIHVATLDTQKPTWKSLDANRKAALVGIAHTFGGAARLAQLNDVFTHLASSRFNEASNAFLSSRLVASNPTRARTYANIIKTGKLDAATIAVAQMDEVIAEDLSIEQEQQVEEELRM